MTTTEEDEGFIRFNSYMVRFKDKISTFQHRKGKEVSIPIWFDLKLQLILTKESTTMFQFLYGSI